MDILDQVCLAACYPVAEVIANAQMGDDGYWRLHLRRRHESWSWGEATVEVYMGLTLPELVDALEHTDSLRAAR